MNNDLISRETLKNKLQAKHSYDDEDFDKGYNIGIQTAIELLDNAPTVPLPDFKEGYKQAIRDGKTNFSRPQENREIRWTDKLSLDNDGNIRDFNGNIVGQMKLLESLLNLQEYCLEQEDCYDCVLRNWCATSPCNWSSKDIGIMVKEILYGRNDQD